MNEKKKLAFSYKLGDNRMKGVPGIRSRRSDVVVDAVGEDGVAFNTTTTTKKADYFGASEAILMGLYGTAAMLVAPKESPMYYAGSAAVVAGALGYYNIYFNTTSF